MPPSRRTTIIFTLGALGIGCLSPLVGCADETRTSGTQVQLTPEDKSFIEGMRGTMKQHRTEGKKAR